MDYKLAKQLKDAGFPQEGNGSFQSTGKLVPLSSGIPNAKFIPTEEAYVPTLSELIQECGDSFLSLTFIPEIKRTTDGGYIAKSRDEGGGAGDMMEFDHMVYGKTAEESVALLYLAINKQNNEKV